MISKLVSRLEIRLKFYKVERKKMSKIKVIRLSNVFNNSHYTKQLLQLNNSQDEIRIRDDQKPYLGILDGKKLVACLWLDKEEDECEFSIITHPQHRNNGYAHKLLRELLVDKFSGKISEEIICEPVNTSILRMIKQYKFSQDYGEFWSFDL